MIPVAKSAISENAVFQLLHARSAYPWPVGTGSRSRRGRPHLHPYCPGYTEAGLPHPLRVGRMALYNTHLTPQLSDNDAGVTVMRPAPTDAFSNYEAKASLSTL